MSNFIVPAVTLCTLLLLLLIATLIVYYIKKGSEINIQPTQVTPYHTNITDMMEIIIVNHDGLRTKDYGFYITNENKEEVSCLEQDKLFFIRDGSIQANHPISMVTGLTYFEMEILHLNHHFSLKMGLSSKTDPRNDIKDSSAFFDCESKCVIINDKVCHKMLTKPVREGDIIGCLFRPEPKKEVTFIHNGEEITTRKFHYNTNDLFPTIIASQHSFVKYNFGQEPFRYNVANRDDLGCVDSCTDKELPPYYFDLEKA